MVKNLSKLLLVTGMVLITTGILLESPSEEEIVTPDSTLETGKPYTHMAAPAMYPLNPIRECEKDAECSKLAEAGYYEARGESDMGVFFVFQNILNRVGHRKWGGTIHDVVDAPRQYSYTHDGSLKRKASEPEQWERVNLLAYRFLHGAVEVPEEFKLVTHYHDKSIRNPWGFKKVVQVGSFTGYQCTGYC